MQRSPAAPPVCAAQAARSILSYRELGETLSTQEVNAVTRLTLGDLLVRFEMGTLEYLSLSWELEDTGSIHLVLFHEQVEGRAAGSGGPHSGRMSTDSYLVADKKEYMEREKKVPKAEFWAV